jgi:large subunit ribosomal protein L31e
MEEKIFTINLRKNALKTPRWKKSNKASSTVREYLKRHMKAEDIKIGDSINKQIWSRGDQKPPVKIKIKAIKTDDDVVKAEMFGHVFEEELKEEKKKPEEKKTEEKSKEETKPKESVDK